MRDQIIINSTIKKRGNGFFLPITKKEVDILEIHEGDDLEIIVTVKERKA